MRPCIWATAKSNQPAENVNTPLVLKPSLIDLSYFGGRVACRRRAEINPRSTSPASPRLLLGCSRRTTLMWP